MPYASSWLISAIASSGLLAIAIIMCNAIESSLSLYGKFSKIVVGFLAGLYSSLFLLTGITLIGTENTLLYDFRFLLIGYVGGFFGVAGLLAFSVPYIIISIFAGSNVIIHASIIIFALVIALFSSTRIIKVGVILLVTLPIMAFEPVLRGLPQSFESMSVLVMGTFLLMVISAVMLLSHYLSNIYLPFFDKVITYIRVTLRHYDDICHFSIDVQNDKIRISKGFFNMFELPEPERNTMSYTRFEELLRTKLLIGIPKHSSVMSVLGGGIHRVVMITAQTHSGKLIKITSRPSLDGNIKGTLIDITYSVNYEVIVNIALKNDYVTGMKTFYGMKDEMLQEAVNFKGEAVQVHLSIEGMSHYSSLYGIEFRESMIKIVASKLREVFKKAKIYYFSDGEFHIIFFSPNGKSEFDILQRHFNNIFSRPSLIKGHRMRFRMHSGVNISPASLLIDPVKLDKSILETMWAQEMAKTSKRDEPYFFDEKEYSVAQKSLKRYEALPEIISNRQFETVYQPIVDVKTGTPFAYEVLTRVKNPAYNNVHQLIEDSIVMGMSVDLDTTLLSCIYNDLLKVGMRSNLFINKLPETPFVDEIKFLQKHIHANGYKMFLELTEYDRYNLPDLRKMLKEFIEADIHVVLDDYGSGYSSPIFLANISPEIVKIDMDLIRNIEANYNKEHLVQGLIDYCKRFEIKCVAEGISSKSELAKLISMGVDYVQGFYICRPEKNMPDITIDITEEIKELYEKSVDENKQRCNII